MDLKLSDHRLSPKDAINILYGDKPTLSAREIDRERRLHHMVQSPNPHNMLIPSMNDQGEYIGIRIHKSSKAYSTKDDFDVGLKKRHLHRALKTTDKNSSLYV